VAKGHDKITIHTLEGTLLCSHRLSVEKGTRLISQYRSQEGQIIVIALMHGLPVQDILMDRKKASAYCEKNSTAYCPDTLETTCSLSKKR